MGTYFGRLQLSLIRRNGEDRLGWKEIKSDKFSVKSFYFLGLGKKWAFCCKHSLEPMGADKGGFLCWGSYMRKDFNTWFSLEGGGEVLWRDVSCLKGKDSRLITCFFIVPKQESCGSWVFSLFGVGLGDVHICDGTFSQFVWFLCGKEVEESLEGRSFMLVLDAIKGKK